MKKLLQSACILVVLILILLVAFLFIKNKNNSDKPIKKESKYELLNNSNNISLYISSYEQYIELINKYGIEQELNEEDFNDKKYLIYVMILDSCSETIEKDELKKEDNKYKLYFDVSYGCGICAPMYKSYIYVVDDILDVEVYTKTISKEECDPNVAYKPIIYVYPEKDMDLTIKLGNTNNLLYTYPKYKNEWNVRVSKDGNIYDYETKRNYYGLYWEGIDNYKLDMSEGFVVKGSDTVKFLEEKLSLLGLNEYEINEFIIYWIDKLESNNYNFISFRNIDDINKSMPLEFSEKPDTLIRVMMDFKVLDDYLEVKEQSLTKVERKGYTIVEWGGTYFK